MVCDNCSHFIEGVCDCSCTPFSENVCSAHFPKEYIENIITENNA